MLKTFEIGVIYGDWLVAQVAPGKGKLININSASANKGNRFNDKEYDFLNCLNRYFFLSSEYPNEIAQLVPNASPHDVLVYANLVKASLETETKVSKPEKKKADVVEFFRFVRPWDSVNECPVSTAGATVLFRADYKNKQLTAAIAVSKEDNFCKETGKGIARARMDAAQATVTIYMPDGIGRFGAVVMLVEELFHLPAIPKEWRTFIEMYYGKWDR